MGKILFFGLLLICIFSASFLLIRQDKNGFYNKKIEKFDDGQTSIEETYKHIFKEYDLKELIFLKSILIIPELENNINKIGYRADAYKAINPGYSFNFTVHDNKILGFKNVIFEGVENEKVSTHENNIPSEKWQKLNAYNIGNISLKKEFFHLKFPVLVENTLNVTISKAFFKKLKKLKRIKIILINNEDKKYKIDIENFILKYNF
ncbi:virulence-associated protein BptA [Borreliella americana]|uniref:virulence-associated protein BptA n=1 Tax=Borreliella americana TaxID=478807 RepID=UPI001E31DCD3|nr:protein BptA [Borreliella americana]MCD2332721.1 protein BptA [Borreliella americana]